jgi:hypothetical protein
MEGGYSPFDLGNTVFALVLSRLRPQMTGRSSAGRRIGICF